MRISKIAVILFPALAYPCSCFPWRDCPSPGRAGSPIFTGTVLSVDDVKVADGKAVLSRRKAVIRVSETFGGLAPGTSEVEVLTGNGGGDCGVTFETGHEYLVQAFTGKDGALHTSICSRTSEVSDAAVTLAVLRRSIQGDAIPALIGRIARHHRNPGNLRNTLPPRPLANSIVRIRSGGKTFETRSDERGIYAFHGIQPGLYEVLPDLPPGVEASWFLGTDEPLPPIRLSGGCQEHHVAVYPTGSVQGTVFDPDGLPLAKALVSIVPAGQPLPTDSFQSYWETTDQRGAFRFRHLPPGQYQVLVNLKGQIDPDFPYPRTYSANQITIYGGEAVSQADIHLERQFIPRHVQIHVVWSDGRPIADQHFHIDATAPQNPAAVAAQTPVDDASGIAKLRLHPEEPYSIQALVICRYADKNGWGPGARFTSEPITITPDNPRSDFSLTVPVTGCPEIPGKTLLDREH